MIRFLRILGALFMASGALILLTYLIEPLRAIWPWFRQLDGPIQFGLGLAALGGVILVATVIWERWEEHERENARQLDERL